jgi:hypothetical protein
MVSEADWEAIALERLAEHSWEPQPGQAIAPGTDGGRISWDDLVLARVPCSRRCSGSTRSCRPSTWSRS